MSTLQQLASDQAWQDGSPLPQRFYVDPAIFSQDMTMIAQSQWLLVAHVSEVPEGGSFMTYELGDESIIIIRGKDDVVRSFHNACRHRGSRLCTAERGNARMLVCPYHSWSYNSDGTLRKPADMPADFDPSQNGLLPVHCEIYAGLVFINLSAGDPPSFGALIDPMRQFGDPYGIENTKVIVRESTIVEGNWKLLVENGNECYHCTSSHKTLAGVHDLKKYLDPAAFEPEMLAWEEHRKANDQVTGFYVSDPDDQNFSFAAVFPIGRGARSESIGGKMVAPLLTPTMPDDGSQTLCYFNPLCTVVCNPDHIAITNYAPIDAHTTRMDAYWLVRADAVEGQDYDVDSVAELWRVTLAEDKVIVALNQKGVQSSGYRPGRYANSEARLNEFCGWYTNMLKASA